MGTPRTVMLYPFSDVLGVLNIFVLHISLMTIISVNHVLISAVFGLIPVDESDAIILCDGEPEVLLLPLVSWYHFACGT